MESTRAGVSGQITLPMVPRRRRLQSVSGNDSFDPDGGLASNLIASAAAGQFRDGEQRTIPGEWLRGLILGTHGEIHAKGVRVSNLTISGQLDLEAASVRHGVWLIDCTFEQRPIFSRAELGELDLNGSTLPGLDAYNVVIRGNMYLDGATVAGRIAATGASIGGQLAARNASLTAGVGELEAVWAQAATIAGGVFLDGATVSGEVDVASARIGGQFRADGASLSAGDDGQAVRAQAARISGHVFLSGATITGRLDVSEASIVGQFIAEAATLTPGDDGRSVFAQDSTISGGIFLAGATSTGRIDINGVKTSYVDTKGLSLENSATPSEFVARGAAIDRLVWDPMSIEGIVDVRDCHVGTWEVEPDTLADMWRIDGFTYDRIQTGDAPWSVESRIRWLTSSADEHSPGPYQQMAALLRREGHTTDASRVLIAGNEHVQRGQSGRLRRVLFGATISYGYRPWRVLWFVVPLFVVLTLVVWRAPTDAETGDVWMVTASTSDDTTAADDCDGDGACLQPIVYSLDTIVPLVDLGQHSDWTVNRSAPWAWTLAVLVWVSIAAGWLVGLLLAAAAGGLVRQV